MWLNFLNCFMWGLQDGFVNTHTFQILGFEFDDYTAPFAIYQMVQSLTAFICMIVLSNYNRKDCDCEDGKYYEFQLYYTNAMGIIGLLGLFMCFFFDFKKVESAQ